MKNDDFTERWLHEWSLWVEKWMDRSAIGYPSSTTEWRVANGQGRSAVPGTIVPKIDCPRHVSIVDKVIIDSDQVTKQAVYWRYQFQLPPIKLTEIQREGFFRLATGGSGRTCRRKIKQVKDRIRGKA